MVHGYPVVKRALALALAIGAAGFAAPASAAPAAKADLSGLSDLAFGQLNMVTDQTLTESMCAYSSTNTNGYAVKAEGDGAGSAFTLSSGSFTLPYEVRWAGSPGQTNGTALTAGISMSGFVSSASQKTCNSGPATSATLIVTIRGAAAGSARVGSYSGVLSLTITPE